VRSEVQVTNAAGIHEINIPEHALALTLALARNLPIAIRLKAERRWDRVAAIVGGVGVRVLAGTNLAVLGAGAIGAGIARRAAALEMNVRVLRRRPGQPVDGAQAVVGFDGLHDLLGWADAVVIALPLTRETHHLIDERALARMKRSAHLVNVGRGEIVDEEALARALAAGTIAGAALDAFSVEPLPAESPFWTLENVIITPHVSGYLPDLHERLTALFAENLERYLAGRPLRNLVDKSLGYSPQ
jgi:phosphoglycerate dehydrogenase-like enzyme